MEARYLELCRGDRAGGLSSDDRALLHSTVQQNDTLDRFRVKQCKNKVCGFHLFMSKLSIIFGIHSPLLYRQFDSTSVR